MVRGILFELCGASARGGGRRVVRQQLPRRDQAASNANAEIVIGSIPTQIERLSCWQSRSAGENEEQKGFELECSPPGSKGKE